MNRILNTTLALVVPAILLAVVAGGAQFKAPKFLKATPSAPKSVKAGNQFTVTVGVTVNSQYHIQGNPAKEGYIATELEVGPLKGFKLDKVVYPKPTETTISGERLPVYEGKVTIKADVTADKDVKSGKYMLPVTLKYQGCDQQKCFPPTTLNTSATVTVTGGAK